VSASQFSSRGTAAASQWHVSLRAATTRERRGASACGRCQNRCAPLAPQALETGDFGIVVPIVFISLCMVLHSRGAYVVMGDTTLGDISSLEKSPPVVITPRALLP